MLTKRNTILCDSCGLFCTAWDTCTPYGVSDYNLMEPHNPLHYCQKCGLTLKEKWLRRFTAGYRSGDWQKSDAEVSAAKDLQLIWDSKNCKYKDNILTYNTGCYFCADKLSCLTSCCKKTYFVISTPILKKFLIIQFLAFKLDICWADTKSNFDSKNWYKYKKNTYLMFSIKRPVFYFCSKHYLNSNIVCVSPSKFIKYYKFLKKDEKERNIFHG